MFIVEKDIVKALDVSDNHQVKHFFTLLQILLSGIFIENLVENKNSIFLFHINTFSCCKMITIEQAQTKHDSRNSMPMLVIKKCLNYR